jgi:hypothetical protein
MYEDYPAFFHNCFPQVFDPSGKLLAPTDAGMQLFCSKFEGSSHIAKIEGLYIDRYDFPLSDLYKFNMKGVYHVYVNRETSGAPQDPFPDSPRLPLPDYVGNVRSNTVSFEIK